ncbi:hypothetical protein [Thiobacillus sp.]|uniref:hypothetical protein n=1 Tax=Thiobacillus sp. TaxID=924 RepID=UPI00286DC4FE|nr:hypothetical protein [Thiobacillus sp.]
MDLLTSTRNGLFAWADRVLEQGVPHGTVGFHFNLYEGIDSVHVQLTGTDSFVTEPEYWPGDETFTTGEDIFEVPFAVAGDTWQDWLMSLKALVSSYITDGDKSAVLTKSHGVGIGFVDGDMYVLWQPSA